jgi:hypothetical protein
MERRLGGPPGSDLGRHGVGQTVAEDIADHSGPISGSLRSGPTTVFRTTQICELRRASGDYRPSQGKIPREQRRLVFVRLIGAQRKMPADLLFVKYGKK